MLLTESELRQRSQLLQKATTKKSEILLNESRSVSSDFFDIFLSHSVLDAEIILEAKLRLEDAGFTVYVDWINDPKLDRSSVTRATAASLRIRMAQCKMLVYVHSQNAAMSKWCPWELGFFDGKKGGNVFILPISVGSQNTFIGQEYLGLYPYLTPSTSSKNMWIEKVIGMHLLTEARTNIFRRELT